MCGYRGEHATVQVQRISQRIDVVDWQLQNHWSDLRLAFVNVDNETIKPSAASFFTGQQAAWKNRYFEKQAMRQSSEQIARQLEREATKTDIGGKKVLTKAADAKKEVLKEARAKRHPKTQMRTSLNVTPKAKKAKTAGAGAG